MPMDLDKFGTRLKKVREEKGLELADVASSLCLRKTLVNALETADWKGLPHEVYVKGYIKEYARFLNIYDDIAADLDDEEVQAPVNVPVQRKSMVKQKHPSRRVLVYPVVFALVIGVLILSQLPKQESRVIAPVQNTEHKRIGPPANTAVSDGQVAAAPSSPATEVKKLMITCHERTWVSVVIDNVEKKEFMLNPEDIVVLNAKDNYDLLIGNAAGVKLILNGNDVQFTGQSGEVKRIKVS